MEYNNTNKKKLTMNTDIAKALMRHLENEQRVLNVSFEFRDLKTNFQRVVYVYGLLDDYNLLPRIIPDGKCNEKAIQYRNKGNEKFKLRQNKEALEFYTISIVFGEKMSEDLAKAYANRSAVLFEQNLYKECLIDIERALQNNYPKQLMDKLLTRKEKAQQLIDTQINFPFYETIPNIPKEWQNDEIECASNAIEIKSDETQGRHIVAKRDIEIGEILAVEHSYAHMLLEETLIHCHECLLLCYNLIACENCTQALYCNEKCRENAYQTYHQYECAILKTTVDIKLDRIELFPMKIALKAFKEYCNEEIIEDTKIYKSNRYYELSKLVTNVEKRSVTDLFNRSITAALIYHLINVNTNLFDTDFKRNKFMDVVLEQIQVAACNFHEIVELYGNDLQQIGDGAFPFTSMFNHSCNPNVMRTNYGTTIVKRALLTIKKGEQCYDNYGYHYALTEKQTRQFKLNDQYYFNCDCLACKKEWPLLLQVPSIGNCNANIYYKQLENSYDRKMAQELLPKIVKELKNMEKFGLLNYNVNLLQELMKRCFHISGNVRLKFK